VRLLKRVNQHLMVTEAERVLAELEGAGRGRLGLPPMLAAGCIFFLNWKQGEA